MHISITGLKPKGLWGFIRFWTLAIPSFGEAKSAKGNLFSAVKKINGYNCTLSDESISFYRYRQDIWL